MLSAQTLVFLEIVDTWSGKAAPSITRRLDVYLRTYPFPDGLNVRDDADGLSLLAKPGKHVQSHIEGVFVQCAETFVEKDGVYTHISAGHTGKTEGQRETDEEAFAAREIA